jgi:hypothetical protein
MIKIDFEIKNDKYGVYRDALYFPEDHAHSEADIEAMKQERYNNWLNIIENPPVVDKVTPVVEDNPDDYIEINGVRYKKAE